MNNSQILDNVLEEKVEVSNVPLLRKRQEELTGIIEAIDSISQSNYYKLLEKKVFKGLLDSLVNQLCTEKDSQKVAELQGSISILSKYSDFKKFSETYRLELKRTKANLKGQAD